MQAQIRGNLSNRYPRTKTGGEGPDRTRTKNKFRNWQSVDPCFQVGLFSKTDKDPRHFELIAVFFISNICNGFHLKK